MNLSNIQNWIVPFSVVIGVVVFAFSKFREVTVTSAKDSVETLEKELEIQKDKNTRLEEDNRILRESFQNQMNDLNKTVGELKGRISELSKQNETLTNILQGKNPEQEKFMQILTESAGRSNQVTEAAQAYMDSTLATLKEIQTFMKDLHDRNKRVDKGGGK